MISFGGEVTSQNSCQWDAAQRGDILCGTGLK